MQLENKHFRAIGNLAFGMSVSDVARDCGASMAAVYRWKKMPEFKAALGLEVKKHQAAAPDQIQTLATESFESMLDAQRELRAYALGRKSVEYPRVMALMVILKFGARWIDLAGFTPKLKEAAAKLAFQLDDAPDTQEVPELLPNQEQCGPGDRQSRPKAEQDPPPAILGARTIDELADHARADRIKRGLATEEEIAEEKERPHLRLVISDGSSPDEDGGNGEDGEDTGASNDGDYGRDRGLDWAARQRATEERELAAARAKAARAAAGKSSANGDSESDGARARPADSAAARRSTEGAGAGAGDEEPAPANPDGVHDTTTPPSDPEKT